PRPGTIVDGAGRVLGHHRGAYRYTVGQRRGLGVSAPSPRYVLSLQPATGTVVVGDGDELVVRAVVLERASSTDGRGLRPHQRALVRLRAHGREGGCEALPERGGLGRLELDEPGGAGPPGQAGP